MKNLNRERMSGAVMLVAGVTAMTSMPCTAAAGEWSNPGGNAGRCGLTSHIGPDGADLVWTYTARNAIHACQPMIEGSRVFVTRDVTNPPEPPAGTSSPVVAIDVNTGAELWHQYIPFESGDWTTWVGGVKNGLVFATRAGDGLHAQSYSPIYALNAADGSVAWISEEELNVGPACGIVFADNGDLIIGGFKSLTRIRWTDGTTVWSVERLAPVASSCGAAVFGNSVYISDYYNDGYVQGAQIIKYDLVTGAKMYEGLVMEGGHSANPPMCGPDGAIYYLKSQNYAPFDKFYSFKDTGTELVENWRVPAGSSSQSEFGVGPDGSVYTIGPGGVIQRLNPANGTVISTSSPIPSNTFGLGARFAIDGAGKVFFCNGATTSGRLYSFNADLTERWSVDVPFATIGGPAISENGTLVQVGRLNVRGWRTHCLGDANGDRAVNFADITEVLQDFGSTVPPFSRGDANGDGIINFLDITEILGHWTEDCSTRPGG